MGFKLSGKGMVFALFVAILVAFFVGFVWSSSMDPVEPGTYWDGYSEALNSSTKEAHEVGYEKGWNQRLAHTYDNCLDYYCEVGNSTCSKEDPETTVVATCVKILSGGESSFLTYGNKTPVDWDSYGQKLKTKI